LISRGSAVVFAPEGLHARPAADFVRAVSLSGHSVTVTNAAGRSVDGASILAVLSLGVRQGQTVELEVRGEDSQRVLDRLIAVVSQQKQG
jgi:phosphocarrier protein